MTPAPGRNDRLVELAGELRTVINRLAFHLRTPAMEHGITPTRLSALVALERSGPLRPGDLAGRLGITAASMSRLCDVLEEASLIRRDPDSDDQRATRLTITAHGATELAGVRRAGTEELVEDLRGLTRAERNAVAAALPVLVSLADKHLGQAASTQTGSTPTAGHSAAPTGPIVRLPIGESRV